MLCTSIFRRFAFIAVFTFAVFSAFAQPPKPGKSSTDPTDNPRTVKSEPNIAYEKWINEDVGPIATKEEVAAFKKLTTNEERENFIEYFWRRRDSNPETEVNEYREQYYERIAYANEHFASGVPGWKTDRGRIYIRWGKPDSVEAHPSGGSYNRPSYEGGGTITSYPFETWFYRHLDGVGDGIEIEFVDPTGTGEYKIARDANEKNALANVPGANPTLSVAPPTCIGVVGNVSNARYGKVSPRNADCACADDPAPSSKICRTTPATNLIAARLCKAAEALTIQPSVSCTSTHGAPRPISVGGFRVVSASPPPFGPTCCGPRRFFRCSAACRARASRIPSCRRRNASPPS